MVYHGAGKDSSHTCFLDGPGYPVHMKEVIGESGNTTFYHFHAAGKCTDIYIIFG